MNEVIVPGFENLRTGNCRVIAEAGANHNNSVARAISMAEAAADAGAWAIKYQLYKADTISIPSSPKYWQDDIGTKSQYEAFSLSDKLSYADYADVADACRDLGIIFFATPFDFDAIEALEDINVPMYKLASGDITNRPLIEAVAETGKPLFLSTGASTLSEIRDAIDWTGYGPDRLVPMACTLTYPTPDEDGNFARLEEFRRVFTPYLVGMSDHTIGPEGGWMTAALGGVCIEKHYTLDPALPDVPDHKMSVDPTGLAALVAACNRGSLLRGSSWIGVRDSEKPARDFARRSIVLERDIDAHQVLQAPDLGFKRPGTGIPPYRIEAVVGARVAKALGRGHMLQESDLE